MLLFELKHHVVKEVGKMARLTVARIKTLTEPGRYGDGEGLYLSVSKTGTRSWVQRIVDPTSYKRRDIGLGSFPTVTLANARELAADNRKLVASGQAPVSAKDRRLASRSVTALKPSKPTFRAEAEAFHAENAGIRWTNAKNIRQWLHRCERHLFPPLEDRPVDEIEGVDVLNILVPLKLEKPEVFKAVKTILNQVFQRAQARGLITVNPVDTIKGGLPHGRRQRIQHMKALHYSQVVDALAKIDASAAYTATKLAIRLMALTASRGAEIRFATWGNFDLEAALWVIPAESMKAAREHRVTLSTHAVEVLRRAEALSWDSEWVFPSGSNPGKPLSENAFSKLFRECGIQGVPHGLRTSFKVWAEEQSGASWAAIEMSLAHAVGNSTERAYFRSDLLDQRRALMQAWGDFISLA